MSRPHEHTRSRAGTIQDQGRAFGLPVPSSLDANAARAPHSELVDGASAVLAIQREPPFDYRVIAIRNSCQFAEAGKRARSTEHLRDRAGGEPPASADWWPLIGPRPSFFEL